MRHSLKLKITLFLSFSIFLLIFLCWIANDVFLPSFYQKSKVSSLSDVYRDLDKTIGDDDLWQNEELAEKIERIENLSNVNIYIFSSRHTMDERLYFVYPLSFALSESDDKLSFFSIDRYERIINTLQSYIFGMQRNDETAPETLKTTDSYDVYKMHDGRVEADYIDLVGYLSNGDLIFTRTNFSNIEESASISNRFLAISGCILAVLASILMYIFSLSIVNPLMELSEISSEMSNLNFERKYNRKRKDEIGLLGNSINTLSGKLETSISELKAANIELEKDIAKKTEIDEMRREFLSNVSHELKTPIALIQGYAEGLAENVNDDEESRQFYCDVIVDEALKMNNMVKKLLSLNEIEFGNSKLDLSRFDIVDLVKSVVNSVQVLTKQKEASLVFNVIDPVYVWADEYRIEEVVTNYISNALNHVDGPKIIDISFKESDDRIRVSIFNSGKNIPEEDIDHIWDKFYKIDKARTREYGGSGIGLSIVKAIMEAHNEGYGAVNHSSGVEFWFELKKD